MTNKLFKRVITSYLIICIIPIVMGFAAYDRAASSAREKALQIADMVLERASLAVNGTFEEMETIATSLSVDRDIQKLIISKPIDESSSTYYKMYDVHYALSSNAIANENLLDIMLYCERPGMIITSSHMFISLDRFYDKFFRYGSLSLEQWKELMLDNKNTYTKYFPSEIIMMREGTDDNTVSHTKAMLCTRTVRSGSYSGKLIACVSLEALSDALEPILNDYNGCVLIYGKDGTELATLGNASDEIREGMEDVSVFTEAEQELMEQEGYTIINTSRGRMMLVSTVTSLGMKFAAAFDTELVYGELDMIRFTTFLTIGIELFLLIMLAALFAHQSVKPVQGLIELVGDEDDSVMAAHKNDEYGYLGEMITLMKQSYINASRQLNDQQILLKNQLVAARLRGKESEAKLRSDFTKAGIYYPEDDATVALILFWEGKAPEERTRGELARMITTDFLEDVMDSNGVFSRLDQDKFALIVHDGYNNETTENILSSLMDKLNDSKCPQPVISVCMSDGTRTLSQRYVRASLRINRWDAEPGAIDWISPDMELRNIGLHYSVKLEEQIIRTIKAGATAELKPLLDKVVTQNRDEISRTGSRDINSVLAGAFRLTCIRAQREAQFTSPAGEKDMVNISADDAIRPEAPLEDFYAWCMRAAEQIASQRKAVGGHSMDPVCQYLVDNFADKQLSLAGVAEKFGYSETYFSRIFKAQIGSSYSEYLEHIRIDRACELIRQGMSVDATADSVGYNSVTVFRAAFKRICNSTPSEYRVQSEINQNNAAKKNNL